MSDRDRRFSSDGPQDWALQLPLILVVASLFLLVAFELFQLIHDHSNLLEVRDSQEQTVQEGAKLRQQVETLAGQTAQLAADGDAGARAVVEQMQRQGIKLTPPKQ